MSADERIRRRNGIRRPMLILGAVMTLIYLALGSYILLVPSFVPAIPAQFREIFASMLLIYGVYRGWRTYADYF